MRLLWITVFYCTVDTALAGLECRDWRNNIVPDGSEYAPNKENECYICVCDKGSSTICKDVSCAPPIECQHWEKVEGVCCQFDCLDTHDRKLLPNFTRGLSPTDNNVEVTSANSFTDLGLRLVASTVTTFLILALLLFLIHRLRQRRILLTLRRYSRRRDNFDDSDNISYSPDYFVPCPPYEDLPPPYSPPKPPHIHSGEDPPPYEAVVQNSADIQYYNNNNTDSGQRPATVHGEFQNDRSTRQTELMTEIQNYQHGRMINIRSAGVQTAEPSCINEAISDVLSSSGQSERATSVTDIDEISSNVGSGDNSPSMVQESNVNITVSSQMQRRCDTNDVPDVSSQNSNLGTDSFSADADATVRQFLDRQFGRGRRFTPTMSQSWSSAQFTAAVAPEFRQSLSTGCFHENADDEHHANISNDHSDDPDYPEPSQSRIQSRPHSLPSHKATRISYREPDEININSTSCNKSDSVCGSRTNCRSAIGPTYPHQAADDTETHYSFNSCSVEANSELNTRGDNSDSSHTLGAARRQDALRELRLSHLLNSPPSSFDSPVSPTLPSTTGGPFPLQRSQSILSDSSMFSVCSETGEKRNGGRTRTSGTILSNDAPYPDSSYRNFLRTALGSRPVEETSQRQGQSSMSGSSFSRQDCARNQSTFRHNERTVPETTAVPNNTPVNDQTYFMSYGKMHLSYPTAQTGESVSGSGTGMTWPAKNREKKRNVDNVANESELVENNFFAVKPPNAVRRLAAADQVSAESIPTHDMRAFASQYYACEHDDRTHGKQSRGGRASAKRHSAGCFPVSVNKSHVSFGGSGHNAEVVHKRSPKSKHTSAKSKERNPGRKCDGKTMTGEQNSCGHELMSGSATVPNMKVMKRRSGISERKEYGFIDTPDTSGFHARNDCRGLPSTNISPQHGSIENSCNSGNAKLSAKTSTSTERHNPSDKHGKSDTVVHRRSKSDCHGNQLNGSPVSLSNGEGGVVGKKSHVRKKRSRQSFPGTSAFQKELEHVLAHPKKYPNLSDAKPGSSQRLYGHHRDIIKCAVTDV